MQICLITETFPPEINGVAMTIGRLVQALRKHGHLVTVVRPSQGKNDTDTQDICVPGLGIPGYQGLQLGLPAGSILKKYWLSNQPDLVLVITEGPLGFSALRTAKKMGIPVASSFHTNFHQYSKHYRAGLLLRGIRHYLRWFHNQTLATFVPSIDLKSELLEQGFKRLELIGRGVDSHLFNPSRRQNALRQQWGAKDDTPVFLHVGRLAAEKNLKLLMRTFTSIAYKNPNAIFIVVGDGPQKSILEKQYPNVRFVGAKRDVELAEYYASADAFLFPSLTETFGNVTLEALASGLAVVAFDYAAAKMAIQHQKNGLIAQPHDFESFEKLALDLLNPEIMQSLKQNAPASIAMHRWEDIFKQVESTLDRCLKPAEKPFQTASA